MLVAVAVAVMILRALAVQEEEVLVLRVLALPQTALLIRGVLVAVLYTVARGAVAVPADLVS
jgi:hypothetical protein